MTQGLYIDISEDSVMKCTLSVNTGACLSPKDELAQEYLRIRHVQRIEIMRVNYSQAVRERPPVLSVITI